MYESNNRAANNMRQRKKNLIKLQREIDKSTIMVGHLNTPLSEMDRLNREKMSKGIVELNKTISQLDVVDVYRFIEKQQKTHSSQVPTEH